MKSKTLAALALCAAASAPTLAQDRWDGPDKPKHVAASAISAVVVESLFAQTLHPLTRFGLAMAPGILKELADTRKGGSGISGKDIVADAIGVGFGMAGYHVVVRPNYVGVQFKF